MRNYLAARQFAGMVAALLLVAALPLHAMLLLDFGNNSSYRGHATASPDSNGKYWNSVDASVYWTNLRNADGTYSGINFGFGSTTGTDSYNGPAGDTSAQGTPNGLYTNAVINAAALGELGIQSAAFDYYVTSAFTIQNLDPGKRYTLTFYGAHKYNADNTTVYYVCTSQDYNTATAVASASLVVGANEVHNADKVVSIANVAPQFANSIWIKFQGATTANSGYLNAMKIEEAGPLAIVITNGGVTIATNSYTLKGTNSSVVGTMIVSNTTTGARHTLAAPGAPFGWAQPLAALVAGANTIVVSGTNTAGVRTSVATTVTYVAGAPGKKVLVHYMPWYAAKSVSGYWGWHWTMNHFNPDVISNGQRQIASHFYPSIGPYDSSDRVVLEYHTLLMKLAGIDGVIVDWYGSQPYYDYPFVNTCTLRLFEATERAGLDFSICYEDQTIKHMIDGGYFPSNQAVSRAQQDILQLQQRYFWSPRYVRHNNQPLLLNFGPQYFSLSSQWESIFSAVTTRPCFVTLDSRRWTPTVSGAFPWPPMWMAGGGTLSLASLNSYLSNFEAAGKSWPIMMGMAVPEFHDIYAEAGVGSSYGRLYPYGGLTFSNTLARALTNASHIVQVTTWNDFGEGTIIEPTTQFGYQYLGIMQHLRRRYLDATFAATTNDLHLARRLYDLRRTYVGNVPMQTNLNWVFGAIVSGRLAHATSMLTALEQGQTIGLRNPGFESYAGTTAGAFPSSWTRIQQAWWAGAPNTHSGTGAVMCSGSGNWGSLRQTLYNTDMAGRLVFASVWGMIPSGAVVSSGWNGAVVSLEHPNGSVLASTNFITVTAPKGTWLQAVLTVPGTASMLDMVLQAASTPTGTYFQGQVYFDDAELSVVIPEAPVALGLLLAGTAAWRRRSAPCVLTRR